MSNIVLDNGFGMGGPWNSPASDPKAIAESLQTAAHQADLFWMKEAMTVGLQGIGIANPNPSVGCVLLDAQGKEVARGATQAYLGWHAERSAFSQVQHPDQLDGGTAYVTLEPCSHQGNQPPCVDLLLQSRIRRIVVARKDPNPLVCGQGIEKLLKAGKKVDVGIYAHEATAWNIPFFGELAFERPIIALKWAQTLDGQLADDNHHSQWITGPEARAYSHRLRQKYDAVLIGVQTLIQDRPQLNVREGLERGENMHSPLPLIFDPQGACLEVDYSIQEALLASTFRPHRPVVCFISEAVLAKHRGSWLEKHPQVILLPLVGDHPIQEAVAALQSQEIRVLLGHRIQSVMIEGGPKTLAGFLKEGFGDVLHVFIAPILTGGQKNRVFAERLLESAQGFHLISTAQLGADSLMEMVSKETMKNVFLGD